METNYHVELNVYGWFMVWDSVDVFAVHVKRLNKNMVGDGWWGIMNLCKWCRYARKLDRDLDLGLCCVPLPYWLHVNFENIRIPMGDNGTIKCFAYKPKEE